MGLDRVIVVTPFHGREHISKIFLENIKDLGLNLVAVCNTGDDNFNLCSEYTEHAIIAHQNITGDKWNKGLLYAKGLEWDYLLVLGSDDLVSINYFEDFLFNQMDKGEKYSGLLDATAMDFNTKKSRYWEGYKNYRLGEPIGCGRLIHRSIVEYFNYELFPKVSRGTIDLHSHNLIKSIYKGGEFINSRLKPYRLGLKSGKDITGELKGCPFIHCLDLEKYYPKHIINMILC